MSTGIPKSVREAMSRQAVKGPHPGADDLTAYAERVLAEQQDAVVAGHLATCAECREVVFLANSAYEAPAKPMILVERRSMWRWAMPATALLAFAIGFVALLRNENPKTTPPPQLAKATDQILPAATPEAAKSEDKTETKASLASIAKPAPSVARKGYAPKRSLTGPQDEAPLIRAGERPRPVMVPPTLSQPAGAGSAAGSSIDVKAANAASLAGPTNAMAGISQNTNAQNVQNAAPGGPSQRANAQMATQKTAGNYNGDDATKDMTMAAVQPPLSPASRRAETKLPEQRSTDAQLKAFAASTMELDAAPQKQQRNAFSRMALTVWRISSDGHLERMMQNQWRRALGGVQKSFRAVAYMGNHVWAGGAGPELYHSADGGESWGTLKVKTEDAELRGTMQSIKASDDKHVAIIADDGSVWVTADGGQTWAKQ